MWLKKLKQKKLQFTLIALILMCITSIFAGCISFVFEIQDYISDYYDEENCPEYFFTSAGQEGIKAFQEYDEQTGILKDLFLQEARVIQDEITVEGVAVSAVAYYFIGIPDYRDIPYFFELKENSGRDGLTEPEEGTIWIPTVFADLKDIQLGDTLVIGGQEAQSFQIAGIYNAAICPASTMAFYPFYMNSMDMKNMESKITGYYGSFTRKDQSKDLNEYLRGLPDVFKQTVQVQYDREALELSFTMTTTILAGIGLAASFLIFIVSIIIIRFIIKSNLSKEYHSIGIYKSMGFDSKKIIGFYLKCYLCSGLAGITAGAALGLVFAQLFSTITVKYLGEFQLGGRSLLCVVLLIPVLTGVLVINLYAALHKIRKIDPVKALALETLSSKSKLKRSLIKNAHSPLAMAVNDICKRRGLSIMIFGMLTVTFYLSIVFLMVNDSMKNMDQYPTKWFALPTSDCYISVPITDDIQRELEGNEYIDEVVFGQLFSMVPINFTETEIESNLATVPIFAYSSFDEEFTGIEYTEGRAPRSSGEIAMTVNLLGRLGFTVGDYIQLEINKVIKDYLITGIYNSMMNDSTNIQILQEILEECGQPYEKDIAFVHLKSKGDFPLFKEEVEGSIEGALVTEQLESLADATKGVSDIVVPITGILTVIFLGFSFLNVINLLLMNNIDNKRKYGILKALGFTNSYIKCQNIIRIMLLSAAGAVAALCIHFSVSAQMFTVMIGADGLVNNIPLLAGLIAVALLAILGVTLLFGITVSRVSPTDLMEE